MSNQTLVNEQQVESFLNQCGLSQYVEIFINEGFDRTDSLWEITETDLIQMQVKRGHRRLLQRAIANSQGIPSNIPLNMTPMLNKEMPNEFNTNSPIRPNYTTNYSSDDNRLHKTQSQPQFIQPTLIPTPPTPTPPPQKIPDYFPSAGTMTHSQNGMSSTEEEAVTSDNIHRLWKRKYHRHAKPDTNAPLKPPSAYVMFSNEVRAELKEQNKSFTDLAKIIGDRWKNISPEEKELYETNALRAREEYLKKIEEYHKTDTYKKYQKYISDFKAENEAAARPVGRPRKRHKRDEEGSDDTNDSASKSKSDDQRQYPFYLLNEDSINKKS